MIKAEFTLIDGTLVRVEGEPAKVKDLLDLVSKSGSSGSNSGPSNVSKVSKKAVSARGPKALVAALIDEGFFSQKRDMGAIKTRLEETGHFYSLPTLSTTAIRLTKARALRRLKEGGEWVYVQ